MFLTFLHVFHSSQPKLVIVSHVFLFFLIASRFPCLLISQTVLFSSMCSHLLQFWPIVAKSGSIPAKDIWLSQFFPPMFSQQTLEECQATQKRAFKHHHSTEFEARFFKVNQPTFFGPLMPWNAFCSHVTQFGSSVREFGVNYCHIPKRPKDSIAISDRNW